MTDVCPKCGRPNAETYPAPKDACIGGRGCQLVSRYYQRGRRDGIDEGVKTAKDHAGIAWCCDVDAGICWSNVDAEAEKAKGG